MIGSNVSTQDFLPGISGGSYMFSESQILRKVNSEIEKMGEKNYNSTEIITKTINIETLWR